MIFWSYFYGTTSSLLYTIYTQLKHLCYGRSINEIIKIVYNLPRLKSNWEILRYIIILFIGWRVAIFFITYFGISNFATANLVDGTLNWPSPQLDYWIRWANWDGGHFRGIAENTYLPQQTVFFPLYPLLMKVLMFFGLHSLWAGLLVSNIAAVIALFFIYKLVTLDFSQDLAKKVIFAILVFPTSFYLGAVYSEAPFLSLTAGAFFFARKDKWAIAAILAGLASATRLVGFIVIIGIFIEYFLKQDIQFKIAYLYSTLIRKILIYFILFLALINFTKDIAFYSSNWFIAGTLDSLSGLIQTIVYFFLILTLLELTILHINLKKIFTMNSTLLLISLIPLSLYMYYQYLTFNSPLSFLINEQQWGRTFSMPWQPILSYINNLVGGLRIGGQANSVVEFSIFIISAICLIISFHKLRLSYTVYFATSLFLPLFSGTLVAMPRYILMIFPLFIILAMIKSGLIIKIGAVFSLLLLGAYSILFINGYWVT